MNGRFPITLHIMTLLCTEQGVISSEFLAGSINVNAVLVRKELSNLIRHGLVKSQEGKNGGYQLARPGTDISLAEIYHTVKPDAILGQAKNQPNPKCPVGRQINSHLNNLYEEVDQALINKLNGITLDAFCKKFD
ncbi:Rrf2 family transcriptional regulator [Mucilaginibacter terrenus]|uniref:Rrf2 family transcriptional regulator n=1 Tax=Mucilaginibacter terrenus TaxID=2482727 RepID=A0A3E2NTK0_9SPHI|nr:Rrf2 family transcriptional regulator [Mucilaginibacter terrenus]RFZ84345.1 Rrf2 family transcriptional regulator [Mucilaginibacter terrenus]